MGSVAKKMALSECIFSFKLMHLKYIIKTPELLITLYLSQYIDTPVLAVLNTGDDN